MKRKLNQLASVLAESANWTWWAGKFPVGFQLEFDTSITNISIEKSAVDRIALAFYNLSSVTFVERGFAEKGWAYQLNSGQISSLEMTDKACGFNRKKLLTEMEKEAVKSNTIYGGKPNGIAFKTAKVQFGFWAGNTGILVASESVKLFGMEGEILVESLQI
jgi:hypothetical protein